MTELVGELERRAYQQEAVAAYGQQAMAGSNLDQLIAEVPDIVAKGLSTDYAAFFELLAGGDKLLLRAGCGYPTAVVGTATLPAGPESQPGHALITGKPVIVVDLASDHRFHPRSLPGDLPAVSGVAMAVRGGTTPYGVLSAHTRHRRSFAAHDMHFLQSMVHILGEALRRHRDAAALRTNEERFRLALDAADIGIWDWNITTGDIHWSDRVYELYGLVPGAETGSYQDYLLRIHPEDRALVEDTMAQAIQHGEGFEMEYRLLRVAAGGPWRREVGRVHMGDQDRPVRMIGLVMDISNRKQAEVVLREQATAAAREQERTRFLEIAAHELGNPMATIKAICSLMRRSLVAGKTLSDVIKKAEVIEAEIDRIAHLLQQMTEAFRLHSGEAARETGTLDLREVLAAAVRPFAAAHEGRGFVVDSAPTVTPWVCGDAVALERVFRNLLNNAVKYSPDDAEITVTMMTDIDQQRVRVAVRDRGSGIPAPDLPGIFAAFYRGETAQRDSEGSGLGLYICREIVRRHDGCIWAESSEGSGSTFYVELPMGPPPLPEEQMGPPEPQAS